MHASKALTYNVHTASAFVIQLISSNKQNQLNRMELKQYVHQKLSFQCYECNNRSVMIPKNYNCLVRSLFYR